MKIDLTTFAFNGKLRDGTGTSNWNTALGQSRSNNYKISKPEIDDIFKGLIYSAVSPEKISTIIGRGGSTHVSGNDANSQLVLGALFKKVYINDTLIENGKFVLLILRDTAPSHFGRLKLLYGPHNKYTDNNQHFSNNDFFKMVREQLHLAENACWFVYEINIEQQDTLILKSVIVNSQGESCYDNSQQRTDEWNRLVYEKESSFVSDKFAKNRIFFGAPGTGKSFEMNEERKKLLNDPNGINKIDYERATFHPNYSYANFVGTYKPAKEEKDITYEYVPGPFMRVYLKALMNIKRYKLGGEPLKPYLLLIEEINRANVAAVFGDIFQLLDRNAQGESEYPIQASEDVKKYLCEQFNKAGLPFTEDECSLISLPSNMFIWATMNSADQGVYPMDTAFKRRWEFEYIGIDEKADNELKTYMIPIQYGTDSDKPIYKYVAWNELRIAINNILSKECHVNEDKLLGPYFVTKATLEDAVKDENSKKQFVKAFESKVLMYLFDDAVKMHPARVFKGCVADGLRYSAVCKDFEERGIDIFGKTDVKVTENV